VLNHHQFPELIESLIVLYNVLYSIILLCVVCPCFLWFQT